MINKITIKNGVKINPKEVVFTAIDKSGQAVWLENGNTNKKAH